LTNSNAITDRSNGDGWRRPIAVPEKTERQHIGNQVKVLKAQYRDEVDAVYSNLLRTPLRANSKVTTLLLYSALHTPTDDCLFSEAAPIWWAAHIQTAERKLLYVQD
jgi:hypothetical protein